MLSLFATSTGYTLSGPAPRLEPRAAVRMAGPFKLPEPPPDFAGAQWAPTCFPPFPTWTPTVEAETVAAVAALVEEVAAKPAAAPAAPAAPAAAPADKSTFTVSLKTPDGDKAFECPPDMAVLDAAEELENAEEFEDLPYACRAGSCSACAGKLVSGTMDLSGCGFLTEEQKADGWVLTCTAIPTSDVVIETHKEDDMF